MKNMKKEEKIIDATGKTLGRIASAVAISLMGKDKVSFVRNTFSGSPVKVINASKMSISLNKIKEIAHERYSGYPGGLRVIGAKETIEKKGHKELLRLAVDRMLPKNKLHKEMVKNLKIEN